MSLYCASLLAVTEDRYLNSNLYYLNYVVQWRGVVKVKSENSSWLNDSIMAGSGRVSLAGSMMKSWSKFLCHPHFTVNKE